MIREQVVTADNGRLLGIRCEPAEPSEAPTVVFLNAGIVHRIGPNRLYVRLARALARMGVASVRFDLSGLGDSGAPTVPLEATQSTLHDIETALRDFVPQGPVVLAGLCSGAAAAIRGGREFDRVIGVIALDPINWPTSKARWLRRWTHWTEPGRLKAAYNDWGRIGRFLLRRLGLAPARRGELQADTEARRLLDPTHPDPAEMTASLAALAGRGGKALFIYCGMEQTVYATQLFDAVPALRAVRGSLLIAHHGAATHSFDSMASQDHLEAETVAWMRALLKRVSPPLQAAHA